MLITCYAALGDAAGVRRAAEIALARAEKILAHDANNGSAIGHGSVALATLGRRERAKDWMDRALLIDPENITMRYNFVCALANYLKDKEAALQMVGPVFEKMGTGLVDQPKWILIWLASAMIRDSQPCLLPPKHGWRRNFQKADAY